MTSFLSRRYNRNLCVILGGVEDPIRCEYERFVSEFATPRGALEYHCKLAQETYIQDYVNKVVGVIYKIEELQRWGFRATADKHLHPLDVQEQTDLAETAMDLVRHMWTQECWTCLLFSERPHYCLASLLSPDASIVKAALAKLQRLFEVLSAAESQASHGSWLEQFLNMLLWPRSTVVREVLVGLHECHWQRVPQDISDLLEHVFKGPGSSRVVELAFKTVTDAPGNSMSRLSRWKTLMCARLLEGVGQKECLADPAVMVPPGVQFDEASFVPKQSEFSLGFSAQQALEEDRCNTTISCHTPPLGKKTEIPLCF